MVAKMFSVATGSWVCSC